MDGLRALFGTDDHVFLMSNFVVRPLGWPVLYVFCKRLERGKTTSHWQGKTKAYNRQQQLGAFHWTVLHVFRVCDMAVDFVFNRAVFKNFKGIVILPWQLDRLERHYH